MVELAPANLATERRKRGCCRAPAKVAAGLGRAAGAKTGNCSGLGGRQQKHTGTAGACGVSNTGETSERSGRTEPGGSPARACCAGAGIPQSGMGRVGCRVGAGCREGWRNRSPSPSCPGCFSPAEPSHLLSTGVPALVYRNTSVTASHKAAEIWKCGEGAQRKRKARASEQTARMREARMRSKTLCSQGSRPWSITIRGARTMRWGPS